MMFILERWTRVNYKAPEIQLTHAQKVWISALEWCESRGKTTAINKKDRDGTPSYYSFQFKPETFRYRGEKYNVLEKGLSDEEIREKLKLQELQQKIVENMVADAKHINWGNEFPVCVKNKIGRPPVY